MLEKRRIITLISFGLLSFIIFYAGQFFIEQNDAIKKKTKTRENIKHTFINKKVDGRTQKINIIEADVSSGKVIIKPVLSYNRIFGFELLSTMVKRENAYAAVNGGFFYEYGEPSGLVIEDGNLINMSSGEYPVFRLKNGKATLKKMNPKIKINYVGGSINNCKLNYDSKKKSVVIFNKYYGNSNGLAVENITATVLNGKISKITKTSDSSAIPKNGFLISFIKYGKNYLKNFPFQKGDRIWTEYSPKIAKKEQTYECGCWLVKNGKNIAPKNDKWIGSLENNDPRTAIGIKKNGNVVLMTCDGRQENYSYGLTGYGLAKFLISIGIKNAAMLDGGASTEMIVNGKIVNRISNDGSERLIAGAIAVKLIS